MRISVKADVDAAIKHFGPTLKDKVLRAAGAALNKLAVSINAEAHREVVAHTGYKISSVRKQVYILTRASKDNLITVITATRRARGHVLNLIEVVVASKRNTKAFRKRIKRGNNKGAYLFAGVDALRSNKLSTFPGTFIIPGKTSGKMLVFSRKSESRAGGKNLKFEAGPSIVKAFARRTTLNALRSIVNTRWPIEFERAIRFIIK